MLFSRVPHRRLLEWLLLAPDGPSLGWQLQLRDHQGRSVADITEIGGHSETAAWLQTLIDDAAAGRGAPGSAGAVVAPLLRGNDIATEDL